MTTRCWAAGSTSLKQSAATQLGTTEGSYRKLKPMLDQLPAVLGAHAPRTYLLTIMNPAEQRFSGGATLQMAALTFDHGTMTFGRSHSVADVDHAQPFLTWRPVPGNLFHPPGPRRLAAATYSPWWQVSGEELLRAWQAQTGHRCQGLIAVDLQALAELFRITGPMQVPGYGELNADNLVHTLAGSYDSFQDPVARRRLNNALVPAFQQKFLSGGDFIAKGRSLLQDAQGRHVALYFRDQRSQRAFADAGFAGNLSTTPRDYLGVFSQNLNGSKADYWQTRQVATHVTLRPDGSASDRLSVIVGNPAPPYAQPTPDPRSGYNTRWLGTSLSAFLPVDARLGSMQADGRPLPHAALDRPSTAIAGVVDRPVLHHTWLLAPHGSGRADGHLRRPPRCGRRPGHGGPDLPGGPRSAGPRPTAVQHGHAGDPRRLSVRSPAGRLGVERCPHRRPHRAAADHVGLLARTDRQGLISAAIRPRPSSRSTNRRTSAPTTSAGTS